MEQQEKLYECVKDWRGMHRWEEETYSINEWRKIAIGWANNEKKEVVAERLKNMPEDKVMFFISVYWEFLFKEVK